jgi:proline iminopeptidase
MQGAWIALAAVLVLVGIYAFGLRPRLVRWGATDQEVARPYPGDDLIPGAERGTTMAITVEAPPSAVWPWLVQMGVDRGLWYTWDYWRPRGLRSADRIHPEWQDISVGYRMPAVPTGSVWWEVAALEPERFLALRMSVDLLGRPFDPRRKPPRFYTDSIWSFLLERLPGEHTRLVVSGYWAFQPHWLKGIVGLLLLEPSTWIMQTRQFKGLKRRAERRTPVPVAVPGT